jgi:hypothetical protein
MNPTLSEEAVSYRFNEDKTLQELQEYIDSTYRAHYVSKDQTQAFDMINAAGHGEGFCMGNILKYASRFGKKAGKNRQDILKIIHYAIMALYVHDKEKM